MVAAPRWEPAPGTRDSVYSQPPRARRRETRFHNRRDCAYTTSMRARAREYILSRNTLSAATRKAVATPRLNDLNISVTAGRQITLPLADRRGVHPGSPQCLDALPQYR